MSAISTDDLQRRFKAGIGVDVEEAALALPFVLDALDEVRREATYFSGRTEDLRIDFQAMRSRAENAELQAQLNGREVYGLYMKERERAEKAEAQVAAVRAALDAQPE